MYGGPPTVHAAISSVMTVRRYSYITDGVPPDFQYFRLRRETRETFRARFSFLLLSFFSRAENNIGGAQRAEYYTRLQRITFSLPNSKCITNFMTRRVYLYPTFKDVLPHTHTYVRYTRLIFRLIFVGNVYAYTRDENNIIRFYFVLFETFGR